MSTDDPLNTLAVLVGRALNLNPNPVLAHTVFRLSQSHPDVDRFHKSLTAFGRFSKQHAQDIWDECQKEDLVARAFAQPGSHANGGRLAVHDHDVLEPDAPVRAGLSVTASADKHVFKAPSLPARSTLGLDRLAADKRRERDSTASSSSSAPALKRIKYDDDDDVHDSYKSASSLPSPPLAPFSHRAHPDPPSSSASPSPPSPAVPARPTARPTNPRSRPDATPSAGSGLSDTAARKLAEHRAKRAAQAPAGGDSRALRDADEGGKRAMEGFRERLNRNEERRRDDGRRGGYDARDRERDDGYGGRSVRRDDARGRDEPQTPGGSFTSSARLRNQGWDSTPRSERGPSATPRSRAAGAGWDSTPRSSRGGDDDGGYDARRGGSSSRRQGGPGEREWDTPRSVRVAAGDESPGPLPRGTPSTRGGPSTSRADRGGDNGGGDDWEQDARGVDREWYNIDEAGGDMGGGGDFDGYDAFAEREAELIAKAGGGAAGPRKRVTARQAARNADSEQWERNQLALSGVTGERRTLDFDALDDDEESRVHIIVHDLKPPFLDGRQAFTRQLEPVNPIKDPTSDLAIFSKKGSALVSERRAQRERERVRPLFLPSLPVHGVVSLSRSALTMLVLPAGCGKGCEPRWHDARQHHGRQGAGRER